MSACFSCESEIVHMHTVEPRIQVCSEACAEKARAVIQSISICGKCEHAQMHGVYGTCKYPLPVLALAVQPQVLDYFTDATQCPSYKAK